MKRLVEIFSLKESTMSLDSKEKTELSMILDEWLDGLNGRTDSKKEYDDGLRLLGSIAQKLQLSDVGRRVQQMSSDSGYDPGFDPSLKKSVNGDVEL